MGEEAFSSDILGGVEESQLETTRLERRERGR